MTGHSLSSVYTGVELRSRIRQKVDFLSNSKFDASVDGTLDLLTNSCTVVFFFYITLHTTVIGLSTLSWPVQISDPRKINVHVKYMFCSQCGLGLSTECLLCCHAGGVV